MNGVRTRPAGSERRAGGGAALLMLALLPIGCNEPPPSPAAPAPASQPGGAAAEQTAPPPARNPILRESREWTAAQCVAFLGEETRAISAAARLVVLSGSQAALAADPLPAEVVARLRLVRVSNQFRVLGVAAEHDEAQLRTPVWIDGEGGVITLPEACERTAVLHVAADADIFPHLVICGRVVFNAADPEHAALTVQRPEAVEFELRQQDRFRYVALVLRPAAEPAAAQAMLQPATRPAATRPASHPAPAPSVAVEVVRYKWDPYELVFTGPAVDKLPDPPGGKFELNVAGSHYLVPVGGEIPEPPTPKPPPAEQEQDLPPPF
jgi:hypothetical protein